MTSFQVEPPTITIRGEKTTLRPYTLAFETRVLPKLRGLMEGQSDAEICNAAILAFAVFHSLPPSEASTLVKDGAATESAIQEAEWELSAEDFMAVNEYTKGVLDRHKEASVTVDSTPGKP